MMMRILLLLCFACIVMTHVSAQQKAISYTESDSDFVNPERGFYIPLGTKASNFHLLDIKQLVNYRVKPQQLHNASYQVQVSLLYRAYELDNFKNQALSSAFLDNLQKDFNTVRAAGLKMILRFAYTNATNSTNCKGQYDICPPYGDAPRQIVLNHIAQLKPLLQKNADVIAVFQEGFIGIWGENYFTDYFGDASTNASGVVEDTSWVHRNELLQSLLDALPRDRMVQVRTPQIKQRFIYGPHSAINSAPLYMSEAFKMENKSRVGFHNDCFLASADDYGTFADYGNSQHKRDTANQRLRKYFEADSRYVAVGGETCDDAFSPENDCAPMGHADKEMASMHYSYLNAAYNNQVNNDWDSIGCMKNIKKQLGYRLVIENAELPTSIIQGRAFTVRLQIKNKGYAAPFNPRPIQLVLRNKQTGVIKSLNFKTNIQNWLTGTIRIAQSFSVSADIPSGEYEVLLNLPDGYSSLQNNPLYSIRLANENLWEPATGFNTLQHILRVQEK